MYEQIERYLAGSMEAAEKAAFEALLQTDPRLAERLKEHRALLSTMQQYGQRQELRRKLNTIHNQMEHETAPEALPAWRVFWNRHAQTMAVAASVSLLSVFGTLWSVQQMKAPVQQQTARYVELRREVDKLKKAQTAIIKDINNTAKPAPRPARFSGTGFAISANGYLVTSSHVVEGADSIMIENTSGAKYKVNEVYRDQSNDLSILKIEDPALAFR
ncbi:MAG TPA: trypsin-like peptidase domain-containing protein [Pontibacter sp.]